MSVIYLHAEHGEVEIRGSERSHMMSLVGPQRNDYATEMEYGLAFGRFLGESSGFSHRLNAYMQHGDDVARLVARLNGQCEIHCYVEGEDRTWLAAIVDAGILDGRLRPNAGWEQASAFLKERSDEPVVFSYSVCEQFPNIGIVRREGTWNPTIPSWDPEEEWYELPASEQWSTALTALRKLNEEKMLRLDPATWQSFRYAE